MTFNCYVVDDDDDVVLFTPMKENLREIGDRAPEKLVNRDPRDIGDRDHREIGE